MDAAEWSTPTPTAVEWIQQCDRLSTRTGHSIAYRDRGDGPAIMLLHGFPTWSYDFARVAADLERDHRVITVDFLGYGASDKPRDHAYTVAGSADVVEDVAAAVNVTTTRLLAHDYGGIVSQELLDRSRAGALSLNLADVTLLNSGIDYAAYRPTRAQRLLARPVIGRLMAAAVTPGRFRSLLDGVRAVPLTEEEFAHLWVGVSNNNGHKIFDRLIGYNHERRLHHERWETALAEWSGRLRLVWGLDDPVSGQHVLDAIRPAVGNAEIVALPNVGHYPQSEAPARVVAALRHT